MKDLDRPLPFPMRLIISAILILDLVFIIGAVVLSDPLLSYIGKVYVKGGIRPEGFTSFVYQYFTHIWISFGILTFAAYTLAFLFYRRNRFNFEEKMFFIQFLLFGLNLAFVLFFFAVFIGLFAPILAQRGS
jgi:hypothetical protein